MAGAVVQVLLSELKEDQCRVSDMAGCSGAAVRVQGSVQAALS